MSVSAATRPTYYARVMMDNSYFYKQPIDEDNYANKYFILPKTYFVELTNDFNDLFYEANYMGVKGYVKKESVKAINGLPENAFLNNVKFRVYNNDSRDMRDIPSPDGSLIETITSNSRNITYIGKIYGEEKVPSRPNVWYFCKYTTDSDHYGYVYADYCDDGYGEKISWNENTEVVTYIDHPDFSINDETPKGLEIGNKTTAIVIAILSIPALIFIFLLIKGSKVIKAEKKSPNKEVIDY